MNGGIRGAALWGALLLVCFAGSGCDDTPPEVTFGGVEEGAHRNAPVAVTFTVTYADPPEGSVTSTLDGQPYTSGAVISSEGAHTVEVVARNGAGDETVARRNFTLDFTPPVVTLGGFVEGAHVEAPVTPVVSATDANLQQVEATLDGQPFTSGTVVSAEGAHQLSVTARDLAGNVTTVVGRFTLDTLAPVVVVTGVEADRHYRLPVTPGFSAADANPGSVTATLDGAAFTSGTEVSAEGEHTLAVTAVDSVGHTATRTVRFVLDLTVPVIQVSGLPAQPLVNHAVTPAWTVTDAHLIRTEAKLDDQDAVSGTAISASGAHTLVVSAWDEAGNTASQTATFTIDTTAPVVIVTGVGAGERRNTPATVSWTVQEEHPGTVIATLDGQPFQSGGQVSAPGAHTVVVTARDGAGNEAAVTRAFVIDTARPTVAVESPEGNLITSAADVALVVVAADDGPLADVRVGGASMTRGADGKYRHTLPLMEGSNAFTVEALDAAGNSATAALQVVRDSERPVLAVTSPEEDAIVTTATVMVSGTVTDATAVTLTVAGAAVTPEAGGSFSVTRPVQQGENTLALVATDAAGNRTTVSRTVRRPGSPPTLVVTDPPDDYAFPDAFVTVRGEATSSEAGDVPTVTVDGNTATVDARGRFAYSLEVPVGPRTVRVAAVDRYGQTTETSLRLLRLGDAPDGGSGGADGGSSGTDGGSSGTDGGTSGNDAGSSGADAGGGPGQEPAPVLVVESPQDGTVVGGMRFAVLGRVEGGVLPLQVTVNGLPATVSSRSFSASLALLEGSQQVEIRVRDTLGRTDSATRGVVVDRTAPYLEITRPAANPARVTESPYLLTGTVGDVNLAAVTLNGAPVPVVAGGFSAPVTLVAGDNAVTVEAVDLAGNRRSVVQHLVIDAVPPVVSILQPVDGAEAESAVIEVRVRVTGGSGALDVRIGTGSATRGTDGLYTAQVPLSLGENFIPVTATDAQGLTGSASVRVRYRDVTQEPLVVTGADPLPGALDVDTAALVSVAFNKPVVPEDVPERFEVWARGAKLAGGYSVAPGSQTATFVAADPLPEGERITVRISGIRAAAGPGMAAPYASEFTVRRPMTVVRGAVMDDGLRPLPGVKVEVEGQALSTLTGPDGNWALVGVRGGAPVVLRYEGGITSDGRTLPVVRRQVFVAAEQETLDRRLTLVAVDGASAQAVDGAAGGAVTFGGAHGTLKLEVPEGGLSFASGTTKGFLTATELPTVHRPVPVEDKASVDALWQLGPDRVRLLKPFSLTLPNRTKLPAGRMVVLLGFDERRLSMKRMALGRVRADGEAIVSDGPVTAGSLEFFGYMALTPEQQTQVEAALARTGGTGTQQGGAGTDGGLGLLLDAPVKAREPSLWERAKDLIISSAHADIGSSLMSMWALMDSFLPGIAYVSGQVRSPREHQTLLEMELPQLQADVEVEMPHALLIEFEASYEVNGTLSPTEKVVATLSAVGPNGSAIAPAAGEEWMREGLGRAAISSEVYVPFGTSTLLLTGKTRYDTRAIRLTAKVEPIIPDAGGPPTKGRLTVYKEPDSSDSEDPFHGVVRFKNLPVSITSYVDTGGMTDDKGIFRSTVVIPAQETAGIACADVPLGPRIEEKDGWFGFGGRQVVTVNSSFPVCSRTFYMFKNGYSWADVLVDVRLLYGSLTFRNKNGQPVPATCRSGSETKRNPVTGELESLSAEDSATTEVHFFREDDLEHPVARYAVTKSLTKECGDPENPPTGPHGQYSRVRMGPSHYSNTETRDRCLRLAGMTGQRTPEDESFYRLECGPMAGSFLRLAAGQRLVVFAVNHATGYAGMSTVTVPSINRDTRAPDGTCPADAAAGGPLEVKEGGQTYSMSRCSQAELGIPGDIDLYPPELDVRVKRQARAEGLRRDDEPKHLIRTGGAGTTRDDYLQVTTHWRVRQSPVPQVPSSDGGTLDGGLPVDWDTEEDCDKGLLPDGGICKPGSITDDDADAGALLEMYCSELAPGASRKQWEMCLRDARQLSDVPVGVPPLAGQIVRVTGSVVEQPAVTIFDVKPGLHTVNVQSALRRLDANGQQVTLNNLVRANYYLHVVGNRLLDRDTDGDGYVDAKERRARPPNFEEPRPRRDSPPGLPEQALYLKNVFKRYDARGTLVDQYDLAREHEFRILDLVPRRLIAAQDEATRDLRQTTPAAEAKDLSYQFLAGLLAPNDPGRAGTLSGDYRVRLGTDEFGIDCPFTIDEVRHNITANCGGEYIGDILSASDVLYLELYLSGNAENVLYRFNLQGLAPRRDYVSSSAEYTMDAAMMQDDPGTGAPAIGRPVSQPSTANFYVDPSDVYSGTLRVCLNESCAPAGQSLLKEVALDLQPDGSYRVQDSGQGLLKQLKLFQAKRSSNTGARRFRLPLPPHLTGMAGGSKEPVPVYLVLDSVLPTKDQWVMELGRPRGSYTGAHARAVGQETVAGVNVADGHLSFEHEDFSLPFLKGGFAFKRIYNNQDNIPTHLGVGWRHNFDGWVLEERVGRYVAVVGGQGFVFPHCDAEPRDSELYGNTLGSDPCRVTDNAHGFELRVEAPMDASGASDKVTLKTEGGWTFEFNRPAKGPREDGHRRWMLTRFSDSHGRPGGDDTGWTKLEYEPGSERLQKVTRKADVGSVSLAFTYEDVDTDATDLPESIRIQARSRGFKWMRSAVLTGGLGGGYSLRFEQDRKGNLVRVERSPGQPFQAYAYEYAPVPSTLKDEEKWDAVNELVSARLIHGGLPSSNAPVHWRATYGRAANTTAYKHFKWHEVVTSVSATGMQGAAVNITYTGARRTVTWPDGIKAELWLNESGNVQTSETPAGAASTAWGSDTRGGQVFANRQTSPAGRSLQMASSSRLVLQGVSLVGTPPGSKPVDGLGSDGTLVQHVLDSRFGVPSSTTTRVGSAAATVDSPRDASGNLASLSVTAGNVTRDVFKNARYSADGLLEGYTDAQGRAVVLGPFNALGLPQEMTMTLGTATTGLSTLRRTLAYDAYGRLARTDDVQTGSFETFTHDALGRVLTHTRSGEPQEEWTYTYQGQDDALTVTETLAKKTDGTKRAHQRTLKYQEGLLVEESSYVGDLVDPVKRVNTYDKGRLVKTTDEELKEHVYAYDSAGRLTGVTVDGLREVTYALDKDGNPYTVTDHLGRVTTLAYDGLGRPVFWDWGDGDSLELTRDAQGNVTSRKEGRAGQHTVLMTSLDPLGNPQTTKSQSSTGGIHEVRKYDGAGRVIEREDKELGLHETYEYGDVLGRTTKVERKVLSRGDTLTWTETRTYQDPQHQVEVRRTIDTGAGQRRTEEETLEIDSAGRTLSVERTVGGVKAKEAFAYTERGQVWKHTTAEGVETERHYDPQGTLIQVVDAEDKTTTYTLDAAGRVHVEKGPHPNYEVTYEYDALGRMTSKTVAEHATTPEMKWTYAYLPLAQQVRETADLGSGRTITTLRKFNARDRLLSEEVSGSDGGQRTKTVVLDGPWEKSVTVREGNDWKSETVWSSRDDRGRVLDEEETWSADGLSYRYETKTSWDEREASVTTTDVVGGTSQTWTTELEVDSLGNVVAVTRDGREDIWVYDAAGVLAREQPAGVSATTYTYDNGLLTQSSILGEHTHYGYDKDGRMTSRTGPDGRQLVRSYWPRGMVKEEQFGRSGDFQRTGYTYDANGALLSVTEGVGSGDVATKTFTRGARGELLSVAQPGAGTFSYSYDGLLRLKGVTRPSGGVASESFQYDFLGRQTLRKRDSANWQTTWTGGLARRVDANLDAVESLVDGRGRVARVEYTPGPASQQHTKLTQVTYAYTADDQPWKVTERQDSADVENTFTYDARRLLQSVRRGGDVVSFAYTDSGQRRRVESNSRSVTYAYDSLGRMSGITSPAGSMTVEWEAGGERLLAVTGDTLTERRCHDDRGRLTRVINAADPVACDNPGVVSGLHSRFEYAYDGRGNRVRETYRDGHLTSEEVTTYGYDTADRLTGVRYPDGVAQLYKLSGDGTRLEEKEVAAYGGALGPAGFDGASARRHWRYELDARGGLRGIHDQLHGGQLIATYDTDAVGRLRSEQTPSGRKDYGWDAAGRLTRVSVQPAVSGGGGGNVTATYTYGWDGLRRSRTVGTQTTHWLWADGKLVEERLPGQAGLLYAHGPGMTVSVGSDRIAHDGLGSAVGRVGATGSWHRYDAWGGYRRSAEHWKVPGSADSSLGFTGHAYDADAGLTYAQQRWYAPELGRFLSQDPVFGVPSVPGSMHVWGYAHGNPTRYRDPTGEFVPLLVAGIAIGAELGFFGGVIHQEWTHGKGFWEFDLGNWMHVGKSTLVGGVAGGAGTVAAVAGSAVAGEAAIALGASKVTASTVAGAGGAFASGYAGDVAGQATEMALGMGRTSIDHGRAAVLGVFFAPLGAAGGFIEGTLASLGDDIGVGIQQGLRDGAAELGALSGRPPPPASTSTLAAHVSSSGTVHGGTNPVAGLQALEEADDLVTVYRGTNLTAELQVYEDTGQLMSEAARRTYYETGSESTAYQVSERLHDDWVSLWWGSEKAYVEAHGEFGQELPKAFRMDRTMISVTSDTTVADRFAAEGGTVFVGKVPRSQLIPQTLSGSTESEYLIRHGSNAFKMLE